MGARQLNRTTLTTSRLLDFCSEKELTAQTGHERAQWPLVVLKELVDNALDACEDARVAPEIEVIVNAGSIEVADNGPGIPASTIEGVLDFSVRVSNREAYVAPDRGAQGNALKTIVAIPFVLDGHEGLTQVTAHSVRHDITVRVDPIRQQPIISDDRSPAIVRNGTTVRVSWPGSARSELEEAKDRFLQIAADFTFLNPHLTLRLDWFGECRRIDATDPEWLKWRPSDPTPAHWYEVEHLARLIASYVAHDQDRGTDRTVRAFVSELRGFSGSAKQKAVLAATGMARIDLSALADGQGVRTVEVERLLCAMRAESKPVKPAALGVIGREHLERRFGELGCEMKSFDYRKIVSEGTDGLPQVVEAAFGWCEGLSRRRLVTGINWSPGIVNPFRQLGGFGRSLDGILAQQRAGPDEPIALLSHCVHPRVEYTDRGKSAVVVRG